ncbi:3-dehydroquinate synthase [Pseudomonas tohonis]|uniref:3-dehydroquinate synthase n=1 Tax=Pseudomonas tohonis TaxID=2725477 RepID=UPI0021DB0B5C|nr:3-dehydroquinate synthase [Pseudomonas tohonis]UXY50292.1 3-dehydroquinate synthase [Pseudomonas tohonis]
MKRLMSHVLSRRGPWEHLCLSLALFAVLVIVSFLLFEEPMQRLLASLGQQPADPVRALNLAVLVIALLALDVVLPVPSSMVSLLAVAVLGAVGGYLVIFIGLCLGALLGYWLGAGYFRIASGLLDIEDWRKAGRLATRLNTWSLICLRGVPVLAETSVLAAGMQRYPLRRFLVITTLANAGLAAVYSALGSFVAEDQVLLLAVMASMLLPALFLAGRGLLARRGLTTAASDTRQLEGSFTVTYRYPVLFTEHLFAANNDCLHRQLTDNGTRIASAMVFADAYLLRSNPALAAQIQGYFQSRASQLKLLADPIAVPAGESCKTPDVLQRLYGQMLEHGLDRHCYVLALGGGALLDAVGYACATFHRGVRLIRIPTTVLAQNDAGVGVKNGINAFEQKNLLGAFQPANAVINDFQLLLGLPRRDQLAGLAEAVKVAAIKDATFFAWLEEHADALSAFAHEPSRYAIRRCAELHLEQITRGGDPFERGNGRPLDYGHWAAHKLEKLSQHRLRHGEAVAVGMALDALYAKALGLLAAHEAQRLLGLLARLGFNLSPPELTLRDDRGNLCVLQGLEDFRQHLGGELSIPMLERIGRAVDVHQIDQPTMELALQRLVEMRPREPVWTEGYAR